MRLTPFKMFRLTTTWFGLVKDPRALDGVFKMADKLNDPELVQEIIDALKEHPQAAQAYRDRPRRGPIDVDALAALPEGTLGRAFADFLAEADLDPNDLPTMEADDDGTYTIAHLYETHDIWHVVTGFNSEVSGELGLLAFYMGQFPGRLAPMLLSAGLMNTASAAMEDSPARMDAIARGWALGKQTANLFGVRWHEQWARPLAEIQAELGVTAPLTQAA